MHFSALFIYTVFTVSTACAFVIQENYDFQVELGDGKLSALQLANKYGYRTELFEIETNDGYILELHRITGSGSTMYDKSLPPVLLMHGLLASSADWLMIGPGNALAYELSDMGYDVWLGNARGNRYSRRHKYLSTNEVEFWEFSWHEIGIIDLPAIIDHILEATRKHKLHYIGHSQGTTAFFVMGSLLPDYNEKILLMQALTPVAYMEHMSSPLLKKFVKHLGTIATIIELFGLGEFKPVPNILIDLASWICPGSKPNNLCVNALFLLTGSNPEQIDPLMIPILLGHIPAGSSTKQILHFGQEVLSGRFCQFDYGTRRNLIIYGQEKPPDYNLTNIVAPIILHYGRNDHLAHVENVERLARQLPNLMESHLIDMPLFNHMDFLIAKDAKKLLYTQIVDNIEQFNRYNWVRWIKPMR
ncbi:lipase 3-like [Toxorhynchites rutilus septentrionalis]|uniref:lipase 3-like n=1 Tax=Toxorhynchites rutilus septentrionalis TaxID=329112 RepID=UPI002478F515|nr:lipase 3-like [Toxorhynchites rutilus septentrionalis]